MTDSSPITSGIDFNRFAEVAVTSSTFDGYSADVLLLIRGPSLSFYIRNSGSNSVEYSFNGNTLHGRIPSNSERFFPRRRVSKVWLRVRAGSTTVEIEAWATA